MFNVPTNSTGKGVPDGITASVESEFFPPAPGDEPGANNPNYRQSNVVTVVSTASQAHSAGYTGHALDSESSQDHSTYPFIAETPGDSYDPHFSGHGSTHGEGFHEDDHIAHVDHGHDNRDALPSTSHSDQSHGDSESHQGRIDHEEAREGHEGHAEYAHNAPGNTGG